MGLTCAVKFGGVRVGHEQSTVVEAQRRQSCRVDARGRCSMLFQTVVCRRRPRGRRNRRDGEQVLPPRGETLYRRRRCRRVVVAA